MFAVGIFIFEDSNMTITDNYVASNIYLGSYNKNCDSKCYELAKDDKNPFKIPSFYGEYNPAIYTLGLFLPLENNQTKSFKPNEKWVEWFEFIYRLMGYFLWIMFFSKIKGYLGDKGEIESKID